MRAVAQAPKEVSAYSFDPKVENGQPAAGHRGDPGPALHDRPKRSKRSPAPLFHAVSVRVRDELWEGYRWFVAAFRDAAEKLRVGDRSAAFPAGSFPPALPFVGG